MMKVADALEAVTSEVLPEVTKEAFEDGSSTQHSEQLVFNVLEFIASVGSHEVY